MSQDKIKTEIKRLQNIIQRSQLKINLIRQTCPHVNAVKTHKSNTGNYDPSCDSYWTEFKCPDCGDFWRKDGSV